VLALIAVLTLLPAVPLSAKNYFFPEVRIDIRIDRDGSFQVREKRTFELEGSFSWAEMIIPLRVERDGTSYDARIDDFRVTDESGAFPRLEAGREGNRFRAKWFYSARDERRTFTIEYRISGVIISYPDVTELYWQAIGDGWDKPTAKAEVTVVLPEDVPDRSSLLVYGHGPLSGRSEIVDLRTAHFAASNIPAGRFLEIRVVWPAGMVGGVPSPRRTRASIQAEEERFVRETIAGAERSQKKSLRSGAAVLRWVKIWALWLIVGPALFLVFFLPRWKRVGKDYRFPGLSEYYREPPSSLPPALVENLRREGKDSTPKAFTATIFDLARKGWIEVSDQHVEKWGLFGSKDKLVTRLTLKKDPAASSALKSFESGVLGWLFETAGGGAGKPGQSLTIDELKDFLKKKPADFEKWFKTWSKSIKAEGKALDFIEPASVRLRNRFFIGTLPLAILTANFPLIILAVILIPKLLRRAPAWAEENEKWKGLGRFLDDFSEFKDVPPEAYKLWEQYLVFGILFGNAKKIIKALPNVLRDERAVVPVWYAGFSAGSLLGAQGLTGVIQSIESAATTIQQASTAAAHYSSGGGGGFSGGGGGGGAG
jgi:uncharacterized membrane protein